MSKGISSIKNDCFRQIIISIIIMLLLVLLLLFSHNVKKIKIINLLSPIIGMFALSVVAINLFSLFKIHKIEKNPVLKNELDSILLNVSNLYFLTNNYIIGYRNEEIIKYTDIVLAYNKKFVNRSGYHERIYIVEKTGRKSCFEISNSTITIMGDEPKNFTDILLDKNPNILFGLSKENKDLIFKKYNIRL